MKFAHLGDCHLGGWRQPELKALNFQSFQYAVNKCIKSGVDFILIAGDLFDSAYPPIDTLKEVFQEFRRLKEANIPVFLIAGSHDYSVSGKTFLDVLHKAGFCTDVFQSEERDGKIILQPTIYKNVAIYGYPGKKSGLEVQEIERIKIQDSPGLFKILMLHTAIRDAVGNLPIEAVDEKKLPKVDYLALGHLHIKYNKNNAVYCGPTFPNSLTELEDLKGGSFYIIDTNKKTERHEIKLKDVITINYEVKSSIIATDEIIKLLDKEVLDDKIVILRLSGVLDTGKSSDINFQKIEDFARKKKALSFLKSTSRLFMAEPEANLDIDSSNIEEEIMAKFQQNNPTKFNPLAWGLLHVLQTERVDDEKSAVFEERLISETKKVLGL